MRSAVRLLTAPLQTKRHARNETGALSIERSIRLWVNFGASLDPLRWESPDAPKDEGSHQHHANREDHHPHVGLRISVAVDRRMA